MQSQVPEMSPLAQSVPGTSATANAFAYMPKAMLSIEISWVELLQTTAAYLLHLMTNHRFV